jgi:hypothetical protein
LARFSEKSAGFTQTANAENWAKKRPGTRPGQVQQGGETNESCLDHRPRISFRDATLTLQDQLLVVSRKAAMQI